MSRELLGAREVEDCEWEFDGPVIENVVADESRVRIVTADGPALVIELVGDCCSRSYFETNSLLDARSLLGERLIGVRRAASGLPNVSDENSATRYHAIVVRTDQQSITIDWRNESNGYYDGWADLFVDDRMLGTIL